MEEIIDMQMPVLLCAILLIVISIPLYFGKGSNMIAGIPFFTRLWFETAKSPEQLSEEAGTEAASYPNKVSSKALGMEEAAQSVVNAGATAQWDEKTQQNYAKWSADGGTYRIWLEDAQSLEAKLKVIQENKLAGVAEWSLGKEESSVWNLISQYVN